MNPSLRPASPPPGTAGTLDAWRGWLREWSATHDYSHPSALEPQGEKLAAAEMNAGLIPVRVAVVSSATIDFVLPAGLLPGKPVN